MESNEKRTILIVEDDADMGYALIATVQAAGFKTIAAADGESGLSVALESHPDAILLDLNLPKVDGKTVLTKIRDDEWGKLVPIIILTNEEDAQTIADSVQHSAQGYFIKAETSLNTIVESLQDAIRNRWDDSLNDKTNTIKT
jgi:DNA-binding response OmpR family regulator